MADPDSQIQPESPPAPAGNQRARKRYVLVDADGKRTQKANVYTGNGPYQAAAKAARRLIEKRSKASGDDASPVDAEVRFHVRAVNDRSVWTYVASGVELPPEKATYMRIETDAETGKRKRKRIAYEDYKALGDDERRKVACHRRKILLKRVDKPISKRQRAAEAKRAAAAAAAAAAKKE